MGSILVEAAGTNQLDEVALAAAVFELAEKGELGIRFTEQVITLERRSAPIDNLDDALRYLRERVLPHRTATVSTNTNAQPVFKCMQDVRKKASRSRPRRDPGASALRDGTISWLLWSCSGESDTEVLVRINTWVENNRLPAWWIDNRWSGVTSAVKLQKTFQALTRAFA